MENIHEILKKYWGYNAFRSQQEEIIRSVLSGKDTLALLPTGGGKSLCFQLPAMAKPGICLVVSPLIALMKDQVSQLQKRGIAAQEIHSGMNFRQIDILLNNCIYGKLKFLYVLPERLKTEILCTRIKQIPVNLLAVDEAHCISQWGYDFRPPYLQIADFRALIPQVPCIALTATATKEVRKDIAEKLSFPTPNIFKKSFARSNLSYSVFLEENKKERLLNILQKIPKSGIVYVRSRNRSKQISRFLQQRAISASFYHAGLSAKERHSRQKAWIEGKIKIIVATNAFGMGIDKSDVRIVVHLDLPDSLEAYYQEAGRAGRDEKKAYATLLYNETDIENLRENVKNSFPEPVFLEEVYQRLANFLKLAVGSGELASFDFELERFARTFHLPLRKCFHALNILENQGFIRQNEGLLRPSSLMVQTDAQTLYKFQVANESADKLLKAILRIYGGEVFESYLTISEKKIAAQLSRPTEEIIEQLRYLKKQQILDYIPASNSPQITFLQARHRAKKLPFSFGSYFARKKTAEKKAESIISYISTKTRCRTLMLLEYFDEHSSKKCGVCDSCLKEKREKKKSNKQTDRLSEIIRSKGEDAFSAHEILNEFSSISKTEVVGKLREMLAAGQLEQLKNGMLKLKNPKI